MLTLQYDPTGELIQPLTWTGGEKADGTRTAIAKCGNGHISSLSDHIVHADGMVEPSLVCPYDGCNWHENVKLEGWQS